MLFLSFMFFFTLALNANQNLLIYLLPIFIVVILLNFVLMWMIIAQEIKYKNVSRIGRFFTIGVIIFLLCANLFRAVYLLYLVIQSPDRHFNRYRRTEEDLLADYFSHFPWLFFGLASITFLFKWIDDYYGVPVNWNFNLKKSKINDPFHLELYILF